MASDKPERRKLRKAELEKLSIEQLNDIEPYKKNTILPSKPEPDEPAKISKPEMIETILSREGLGPAR